MTAFIIRRLLQSIVVILLVTLGVFALIQLVPGDPVINMLGTSADQESIDHARHQLGYDRSVPQQYTHWLGNLIRGDLGDSVVRRQPVTRLLGPRIRVTAQFAIGALMVTLLVGIPAGVIAALKRNRWPDYASSILAVMGVAVPAFWLGIMMIILFGVKLHWLPTSGWVDPRKDFLDSVRHCIMPWIVAGLGGAAIVMRQMRSGLIEVLSQDYVRTARAKGLRENVVVIRHAMKNALIPIVTIMGLTMGHVLAGSVIVEKVFAIPGMGSLLADSLNQKDYPVIQGIVLIVAVSIIFSNLLVDISYAWLDPRIKYS